MRASENPSQLVIFYIYIISFRVCVCRTDRIFSSIQFLKNYFDPVYSCGKAPLRQSISRSPIYISKVELSMPVVVVLVRRNARQLLLLLRLLS